MIARKLEARKSAFAARKNECGFVDALKSEEGAIDLASIMVGVIVIGVIAGVIAATVFAVIPWAQDKAAQQGLDSVNQAESVSFAQATDKGAGAYQNTTALNTLPANITAFDGSGSTGGLLQASTKVVIVSNASGAAAAYSAFSLSSTGKIYATTSASPATPVVKDLVSAKTLANSTDGTTKTFSVSAAGALIYG